MPIGFYLLGLFLNYREGDIVWWLIAGCWIFTLVGPAIAILVLLIRELCKEKK